MPGGTAWGPLAFVMPGQFRGEKKRGREWKERSLPATTTNYCC